MIKVFLSARGQTVLKLSRNLSGSEQCLHSHAGSHSSNEHNIFLCHSNVPNEKAVLRSSIHLFEFTVIPSFQIHYTMHCASPRQHFTILIDHLQSLELQVSSLYRTISAALHRMQVWTCQQWPCLLTMESPLIAEQAGFVIVTGFRPRSCADKTL